MSLEPFHPAVRRWFEQTLGTPTEPQRRGWPAIQAGRHTLIVAPTGSGKTLAAFLAAIDALLRRGVAADGALEARTQVVYVSPLKALSNDIQRNLAQPLAGVQRQLAALGLPAVDIRTAVRTGDATAAARRAMLRRPPHLFVTTPESLHILLTSERGRAMLRTAGTVIVDEIHALVGNRRGSHLALTLERLAALCAGPGGAGRRPQRIGLSATLRPLDAVARFLVGTGEAAGGPPAIIDAGHLRQLDLAIELPDTPLAAVMAGEVWEEIYDRLAALIRAHRTTLVFVNTRRLAERVARHLSERLGDAPIAAHHGSMAREQRLAAEQRLKSGTLRALVATASLELGIDIGTVELVCQLGSTRSIGTLLQRVGRAGHRLGGVPKGRLFPLSRDQLVECAALLDAVGRGELDRIHIPEQPLDILAQQIVAAVACEDWDEEVLYRLVRRAYPYRALGRADFEAVVAMLAAGYTTRRGRRGAYLHRDRVHGRLHARRGARLAAITGGGAIPDHADYEVVLEPSGQLIGTVNEDFAVESIAGDIFQLGNAAWRIQRVEAGRVRVVDAAGQPPNLPFWFGEAPARSTELSAAVSRIREQVAALLVAPGGDAAAAGARGRDAVAAWLRAEIGLGAAAAAQLADYLAAAHAALGTLPTGERLVIERFFDESGGMQMVVHAPLGSRLNRAFGLTLRKRFCQRFNFELQAAATEDAIVLSLGQTHSFALESVAGFLHANTVRELLLQALLEAPLFTTRWRWNATRALAVLRWRAGRKVPPRFQRMDADDLLAVVFPDAVACFENLPGRREVPDHPLVTQTVRDCLEEAMDVEALEALLAAIARGARRIVARDLSRPSPLAQEALAARPYAFLDDAPLEERRTQAVLARRWLGPEQAGDLGALDAAAIERVREEAWPAVAANADELHDALCVLGFVGAGEAGAVVWKPLFAELVAAGRAARLTVRPAGESGGAPRVLWIAAERLPAVCAAYPEATIEPTLRLPAALAAETWTPEGALRELVRGRLECAGPITAAALADLAARPRAAIEAALATLEAEGFVLRGSFTPGSGAVEWCERRLLARIHRHTVQRLRREIQPVAAADFMRFLLEWQRVAAGEQGSGPQALAAVLEQLEGFVAPAAAWEGELLPARLDDYDPAWLDALCQAGTLSWLRLPRPAATPQAAGRTSGPMRTTPIALLPRERLAAWRRLQVEGGGSGSLPPGPRLSSPAAAVLAVLQAAGASFFADLVAATGLLRTQVEAALGELVAAGLVTADSFRGLRALLVPSSRRPPIHGGRRSRGRRAGAGVASIERAGRWACLQPPPRNGGSGASGEPGGEPGAAAAAGGSGGRHGDGAGDGDGDGGVEEIARALLRRWGVVWRRLLERESAALPPWRVLLACYWRLEARGEIRGGRFVAGFSGEQFALPEAVGRLRAVRRREAGGALLALSAADPLNLVGIVLPGERLPALAANRLLLRDGEALGAMFARQARIWAPLDASATLEARRVLARRPGPAPASSGAGARPPVTGSQR